MTIEMLAVYNLLDLVATSGTVLFFLFGGVRTGTQDFMHAGQVLYH
jgi:hypothetical protein